MPPSFRQCLFALTVATSLTGCCFPALPRSASSSGASASSPAVKPIVAANALIRQSAYGLDAALGKPSSVSETYREYQLPNAHLLVKMLDGRSANLTLSLNSGGAGSPEEALGYFGLNAGSLQHLRTAPAGKVWTGSSFTEVHVAKQSTSPDGALWDWVQVKTQ